MNKSKEEIYDLSTGDTAYYYTNKDTYESVQIGEKVKIKAGIDQMESDPPIRSIIELETIE